MKKTNSFFGFIVLAAVIGLGITGCVGMGNVTIRTDSNISSVRLGGTLRFSASGKNIVWVVSSTSDGTGPVTNGTTISSNGVLTVAINETSIILYVIATSEDTGQSVSKQVRVTTVTNVAVDPVNGSVRKGRTLQFRASVTGSNNPDSTATWKVSSNAAGTGAVTSGTVINNNGLLTVAANETLTTLYVFATSVVDPSKSGSTSVQVIIPIVTGVVINPSNQSVTSGGTLQFNASVTGINEPDNTVTWRVSSNAAGTGAVTTGTNINANGVLRVAVNETVPALYIFATSVEDPTKYSSTIVTVIVPVVSGVVVSPGSQSVNRGGTLQFYASVTGTNNPSNAITWRVSSNAAGTGAVTAGTSINANGVLTVALNENAGVLYIIATSVADPSKFGNVAVSIFTPAVAGNQTQQDQSQNQQGQNQQRPGQNQQGQNQQRPGQNQQGQNQNQQGSSQNQQGQNQQRPGQNQQGQNQNQQGSSQNQQGQNQQRPGQNQQGQNQNQQGSNQNQQGSNQNQQTVPATPAVTGITISPANPTVAVGSPLDLSATVAGTASNKSVTWKVSSNAAGTGAVGNGTSINNNGKLSISANETAATLYVTATSVADPTKSATIAVTVISKKN